MFDFTTQTVFNHITTATEAEVRAKTAAKDYNLITKDTAKGPELRIGNTRFNKENILEIHKKMWSNEALAKVEFDFNDVIALVTKDNKDVQEGNYRIALYIGLSMNSQDSFYANAFVYKGKPLYIEFYVKASDSAEDIATRVVKIANKYLLFTAEEKILDVTADGGKVAFEGVNGFQIIKKASLQKYDPNADQIDCCNNNGAFVDVITGVPVTYTIEDGELVPGTQTLEFDGLRDLASDGSEVAIIPGIQAFADYNWITYNLRLPTQANTYFWAVNKSELPVVGGHYVQFSIRICATRDKVAGEVVGQRAQSVTTHVLYVLDQGDNVATVEAELGKLGTIKTDADDALADPYANA